MIQRISVLFSRIGRYQQLMRWLSRDSLWRFRGLTTLSLLLGFGGLMAQIGAIGLAAYFAHLLERGETVELLGEVYEPRSSVALLSMIGIGVLILLVIGALGMWVSGLLSVRLRRRYQDFCAVRAVERLCERRFVWVLPDKRRGDIGTVLRLIRGDAGYAGWVAQLLLAAVVPAVSTVIAVVALFSLEPVLSLVALAIVAISMVFMVRVNVAAAHHSKRLEVAAVPAGRDVRKHIAALRDTPHDAPREVDPATVFTGEEMQAYLDARDGRMQVMETSRFISNFSFAVTLVLVLLVLGGDLIEEGTGFGRLFVYLVALRYALFSLRSVTQLLTSINRFFPQIWRYREFLDASDEAPATAARRDRFVLRTAEPRVTDSQSEMTIRAPMRLALLTTTEVNRYTLGFLLYSLLGPSRDQVEAALLHARFVALRLHPQAAPTSAAERFGLPAGVIRDAWLEPLHGLPPGEALARVLPEAMDEPFDAASWQSLPRGAKYAAEILSARYHPAQWILLDDRFMRLMSEKVHRAVLEPLSDRFVITVTAVIDSAVAESNDLAVIADEGRLFGLGSPAWLKEHRAEVEARFGAVLAAGPVAGGRRAVTEDAGDGDDDELELAGL